MIDKDYAEFVLLHEQDIKDAIAERRAEIGGRTGGSATGHCSISDPTASTAIRNVEEIVSVGIEYGPRSIYGRPKVKVRYPERWLKVIRWTRDYYNQPLREEQGRLYTMYFTEQRDRETICNTLDIKRGRYHAMLNDILAFAVGAACGMGIIV